jgi:ribosomal protein S6
VTAHQNPNHYEVITMTETRTAQYEGMFLFPQSAVADLQGTVESVKQMLTARGATICSITKWDERRLAYDIAGNKRGLYLSLIHI